MGKEKDNAKTMIRWYKLSKNKKSDDEEMEEEEVVVEWTNWMEK